MSEQVVGEVLNNGKLGWVYCQPIGEFDVGGFATKWQACKYAVEACCETVRFYEGGDGCSVHVDGRWLAFGNTTENAWIAAHKALEPSRDKVAEEGRS